MATVPPQPDSTPPDSLPDTTPRPDEVGPTPGDVDLPDPGAAPEVGSTAGMEGSTGGMAGTSR